MFTGIVEELGTVAAIEAAAGSARLEVSCEVVTADAAVGDSISVNGCCVTVTELTEQGFTADLMGETLTRTALGEARAGSAVNLERALRLDDRLGGHLVQGHVDGVARVRAVEPQGEWTTMSLDLPGALAPFVAEKGSITLDGVSLTVTGADGGGFAVGLIPHTLSVTTLGQRAPGDGVNVEVDVLARYVARLMSQGAGAAGEAG